MTNLNIQLEKLTKDNKSLKAETSKLNNNLLEDLNKNSLTKVKNTRKKTKIVRTSPGELNSVVLFKLMEMKGYIEKLIRDNLFSNLNLKNLHLIPFPNLVTKKKKKPFCLRSHSEFS